MRTTHNNRPLDTLADHLTYLGHDLDYRPTAACEPTQTYPGTAERIAVYRDRVLRGCAVFHPGDRTFEGAVGVISVSCSGGRTSPGRNRHTKLFTSFVNRHQAGRRSI